MRKPRWFQTSQSEGADGFRTPERWTLLLSLTSTGAQDRCSPARALPCRHSRIGNLASRLNGLIRHDHKHAAKILLRTSIFVDTVCLTVASAGPRFSDNPALSPQPTFPLRTILASTGQWSGPLSSCSETTRSELICCHYRLCTAQSAYTATTSCQ
jgi:hypothetical protein